jgi:hypothetical protein
VNFGLNAGDWATNMTTTRMIVIKWASFLI